jgi:hypothetical protein
VSTLENRLRDAFRADADTVSPDSVPDFAGMQSKPVAGRASLITPVAAAIAIMAIAAGVAGTSSLLHGRAQQPRSAPSSGRQATPRKALIGPLPSPHRVSPAQVAAGPLPVPVLGEDGQQAPRAVAAFASAAGVPRFFVTDESGIGPHADQLVVRDSLTGKIVGTVAPPTGQFFGSVAGAGNRTFVAAVMPTGGRCVNQLYQFQLNASGQPGPLTALHVAVPGNFSETDTLAVTPDGRTIAYATYICGQGRGEFGVIDLATRRVRVWSAAGLTFPVGLSLSANGRLLAFAEPGDPARILNTAAAVGSITARSQILSRNGDWVALAGDGTSFYGCTSSGVGQKSSLTYFWQAVGSTQQHVIASWRNVRPSECMADLDPSGPYLLVQFPTTNNYVRPVILDLRTGATTSVPGPAYYGGLTVAW